MAEHRDAQTHSRVRGCLLGLGPAPFLDPALRAAARFGAELTPLDLAQAYARAGVLPPHCQRNLERGLLPPYAAFGDPARHSGSGLDRAALWACLCPGEPARALRLARADASVDHGGEAVEAAGFLAAAMALAFREEEPAPCLTQAAEHLREDSRIARAVLDACALRAQAPDAARARLLWRHGGAAGSPLARLTSLLSALLLGGPPDRLSRAFSGILAGASAAPGAVEETAARIAQTGRLFLDGNRAARRFAREDVRFSVSFMGKPCLRPGLARQCELSIENAGATPVEGALTCTAEGCIRVMTVGRAAVAPGSTARVPLTLWMPEDTPLVTECNRVTVRFAGHTHRFGIVGAQGYRVCGRPSFAAQPLWEPCFADANRLKLDALSGWAGACALELERALHFGEACALTIEVVGACAYALEWDGEALLRGAGGDGYEAPRARTPEMPVAPGAHTLRLRLDRRRPGEEIGINFYSGGRLLSLAAENPLLAWR